MSAERRSNNFDFVRLSLAALVVYSHSFPLGPGHGPDPLGVASGGRIDFGMIAVNGFFVISGLLIASSFERSRSLVDYFTKRALRIYPGFLLAFVASAFVVPRLLDDPLAKPALVTLASRATLLDSPGVTVGGVAVNGSMWTIQPEAACYVALAAFGLAGGLQRRLACPIAAGAMLAIAAATQLVPRLAIHGSVRLAEAPRLGACFLLGASAWVARDRIEYSPRAAVSAAIIAFASIWSAVTIALVFPIALAFLVLAIGHWSTPGLRHAARFGDLSYGLYLYAFPVQLCLAHHGIWLGHLGDSALVIILSLPLAAASWHVIERPALRWKVKLGRSTIRHVYKSAKTIEQEDESQSERTTELKHD